MTNLYFCDVCNESVPQADLDLGRALVVKGRVICVLCDRAMTQRAQERAANRPANLGLDLDLATPPGAAQAAMSGATPGAPGALVGHAPSGHVGAAQRQRDSSGLAFTALVAAGCSALLVWNWARGEFERLDREAARASQMSVVEQQTSRAELERLGRELERNTQEARKRLDDSLAEAQRNLGAGVEQQARALRELGQKFSEFESRVVALDESLARVSRHDQELMGLSQRLTSATVELGGLAESVRRLGEAGELARGPKLDEAPVTAPEVRPAWFELTTLLQSESTADRWQGLIALGETRDAACIPYVSPLLRDKDVFIRMAAARVLGDLGAGGGVEPLIEALNDAELPVRESAADALRRITHRPLEFDAQASDGERAKRIKALREWWSKEREKSAAGGESRGAAAR